MFDSSPVHFVVSPAGMCRRRCRRIGPVVEVHEASRWHPEGKRGVLHRTAHLGVCFASAAGATSTAVPRPVSHLTAAIMSRRFGPTNRLGPPVKHRLH